MDHFRVWRVILAILFLSKGCFSDEDADGESEQENEETINLGNREAFRKLDNLRESRRTERFRQGRAFHLNNHTRMASILRRGALSGSNPEGDTSESAEATALELLHKMSLRMAALQGLAERHAAQIEILQHDGLRARTQEGEHHEELRSDLRQAAEVIHDLTTRADRHETELRSLRQEMSSVRRWLERGERRCFKFDDWESVRRDLISDIESLKSGNEAAGESVATTLLIEHLQESLGNHFTTLRKNVSIMTNLTKEMWNVFGQMVTKEYLSNELQEILPWIRNPFLKYVESNQKIPEEKLPENCGETNKSGIVRIRPVSGFKSFFVYCDFESEGGPWTVIQNRFEGSIEFYRDYLDYKYGFGNLAGEFWLGLENIYQLTKKQPMELLVSLEDFEGGVARGVYKNFAIGAEELGYPLLVLEGYEPLEGVHSVGDSLLYHAGLKFSTRDRDRDEWPDGNCARDHQGGWWYRACETSNLNGRYLNGGELPEEFEFKGMYWADWKGPRYSLMKSRLALRSKSSYSVFSFL